MTTTKNESRAHCVYSAPVYKTTVRLDDLMFKVSTGPAAVIRQCRFCKHFELVKKGLPGVGRGYGMREGNKARGRIIQHVRAQHASELQGAIAVAKATGTAA